MFFNKKKNIEKLKIVEDEEKKRKEEEEFDEDDDDEFDMESPILDLDIEPEDIDFSKVFAYHSFVSSQSGQVCVIKDEELVLLDDSNDYWWLVRCCRSNEIGYIPADNVETPIERLARVNRRKNLEILVPEDAPIIKTNYAQKKVTFSKHVKIEKTEAFDDSDDDDCKIHRVNTGSYKGKKKKSIFSKLLGKKDKKSKKDNYYNEAIEPYSNYSDIMEEEELNSPAIMINDPNVIMRIGNVPDEEDEDSDTPPSRLDSLNVLSGSSELNRPNGFNDGFIEQNGLDKFLEPTESIEPNSANEINKPNEINKSNENNNLKVNDELNEYNESYNETEESFDKPIEYDNESDEYDKPIEYDNEPDNERKHLSYDKNEILNPGEIVIKVYAGNIELKTQYKNIKIEEDMTARDVLLIAMEKFRIPKSTVDEYYIGVIHFESQEKPVKPDANIMNVIRKLNSKGLPGITVSSRSSLINDTINLLDNRFIKFFLNRKIEEQEKEFKLIRVFIEERDNNNHQIYKTIGVLEHEKVVDVINNALTKFSIYQDKNPYDFTLISFFKHQKVPRDYNDSIYEIIKDVTKYKRRSYDIDFLLKPNKPITPMNQSNIQNDNSLLQNQPLKNAGNSDKPIKPLPENFKPPARTSSSSAKPVPKRTSSKISEKSDRSGITSPNYQPSSITSPMKEDSLLLSFSPPPQLPLYLPFTDARYDSDNSSNPLRFDNNGQDDTIDEDDVSFEDPPRSNSLVPLAINSIDKKVENNEKTDIDKSIDNNVDNNKNRSDDHLNDDQLRIVSMKQRENPPRKSSLDYREENDENPSRINNNGQKKEDIIGNNSLKGEEREKEVEEIKTSKDKNNLINIKANKHYRASLYSDVDESEMNNLNNNDETNKNTSRNDPEKLKINIEKKERNDKNEKLNELSDELDDINELVKQLESEVSPISINSINDVTKTKTENLNDTKSPKDVDNGNEKVSRSSGAQSLKSPLVFTPRVSSVTSPRAIKNKNKLRNSSKSGNNQRPETRERSKSIDQQRPETRERSKSIDQKRPETRERSRSIDQQRPEIRERSKSIDQQRPEIRERSKSIDQQRPETRERSRSIDQQRPEIQERLKSNEPQSPETPERSKSIEQQSPKTPERSKSIEQQSPETPERSKSIEQQSPENPKRSESIEQQSPETPERSKSIEQQLSETPERSKSIEKQPPESPERSKSIEQQSQENPKRSESIEQQRPEFPERTKSNEQQRPEFPERTKSIEQQSPEDPERYRSIEQQRPERPQRLESPIKNKSIEQQQLRLESPIRSKSVEQQQYRMESPIRSKSVEQPQHRLENPIRTKSIEQHRLENPVRTKSIDQQRLESPIRSRSVEQHHLESPIRSKSIEQQRLESPIRSKSVDQPRPLRSKSIDQQYSEDPASLEINLSTRSMEDERRNRRYQRPPRDYDRMDDRSVVSSTVGSVMTDSSREITISDRGVMRDSEGRILNNDRRRMKPRKPSASPIRDNERRMRQRRRSPSRDGERSMEGENMFMSPDMRERYGRPRGPEDNIPPHMRDRRPRGPEDDIPPHMRDRRPRGPEDDIPPHMRDRRPRGPERTPRMGERTPRMGERTPRMGERTPRMGERTPRMGERTPRMNERKPKDPRMSRSCSPNRRRPRAPGETSSPALSSISLRNSPRPPMTAGIELPGKHSSLGRDGGMHKSPLYRNPESVTDSPKPYIPDRPARKNSLNKDHCLVSVERKFSSNSGKFGNGIDDSLIDTLAKTPLIVNEVEDIKLQSAEVQIMNENGEVVNKNSIKSPDSSHVIDFNELLNSLDTTLQNSNISGHSTGISPTRRKNSDDLERIRNIRKSRFEDMEKSLDSSIQKTRANDSVQLKSNRHDSNNIGDNLNNLLKELTSPSPSYGSMNLSGL